MIKPRQAIIFDFDGLILDTETPQADIWRGLFEAAGLEFDLNVYNSIIGGFESDSYRPEVVLADRLNDGRSPEDLLLHVIGAQTDLILAKPINPGVLEILDTAEKHGILTAIGSSSPLRWVGSHLERLGIKDRFKTIVTFDDVSQAKPSPEIFELVLKRLDVRPENAIVLEDSHNGVLAAKAAKIRAIAVPNAVTEVMDFSAAEDVLPSLLQLDIHRYF